MNNTPNNPDDEENFQNWDEDSQIPEGLSEQWEKKEREGLRAGVCSNCGWLFPEDQLSCAHCGEALELPSNSFKDTIHFFFQTPWGWVTVLIAMLLIVSFVFY